MSKDHFTPPDDEDASRSNELTRVCRSCSEPAYENANHCKKHGGANENKVAVRKAYFGYEKSLFKDDIVSASAAGKDLTGELALSRVLLEKMLTIVHKPVDMMAMHSPISDMLNKIQSITQTIHKIEKDSAGYLTPDQVVRLATLLLEAVERELEDLPDGKDRLARLGGAFTQSIRKTQHETDPDRDTD